MRRIERTRATSAGLVYRFGQVFIGTHVQASNDVLGVRARRNQDDRDERKALVGLQVAANLEPVHLGHHDVEQDEIGKLFARASSVPLRHRLP